MLKFQEAKYLPLAGVLEGRAWNRTLPAVGRSSSGAQFYKNVLRPI